MNILERIAALRSTLEGISESTSKAITIAREIEVDYNNQAGAVNDLIKTFSASSSAEKPKATTRKRRSREEIEAEKAAKGAA